MKRYLVMSFILIPFLSACEQQPAKEQKHPVTISITHPEYKQDTGMVSKLQTMRNNKNPDKPLYENYYDIPLVDIHNHDASSFSEETYKKYGVDRTVLFGNISEPSAKKTDQQVWTAYQGSVENIYPSFAGIDIYRSSGIDYSKKLLEKGYLNIGEIVAASTYSPVTSKLKWKGENPLSGKLDELYTLAADYQVPILLHIDPPTGNPIPILEEALNKHPDTIFIFAHANVFNKPGNLKRLLNEHSNLYMDFYAGFTRYDLNSKNEIEDFIPVMEEFSDRFFLGSDSGYGITYEESIGAMYQTIDLLSDESAVKVAYQNYEKVIEDQRVTKEQKKQLRGLLKEEEHKSLSLNKRMANELIMKLSKEE
ncbi:amidohydrolase family protein [Fictibacillus norfolkensis]|uniref:Amidohydrolase n=1 Tax=Fictibacillus norfolkensis TaxID=2762233 RepID=A0ABR8SGY3_9BACL|nr:amidohydrolase [Fictibacillus norfolkensis]MBD7962770.1 amidohydrolase [Fictibacillus norfolkensis]